MTTPRNSSRRQRRKAEARGRLRQQHRRERRRLLLFLLLCCGGLGLTYTTPLLGDFRPWVPGEPVPIFHLLTGHSEVRLDDSGEISRVDAADVLAVDDDDSAEEVPEGPQLPVRAPARATPLEDGQLLTAFFEDLAMVETEEPGRIVRVLHWGDSTIAGDGLTRTVRRRLQERFGDGGPGFVPVHTDPRWQLRPGILRIQDGEWTTYNITHGGAEGKHYGLAGNFSVASAEEESRATLGGVKRGRKRQKLRSFDTHFRKTPEGGTLKLLARGGGRTVATAAEKPVDRFVKVTSERGSRTFSVRAMGDGPVQVYGVALETAGPGVTWEPFGVAGSSVGSLLSRQGSGHLKRQVKRRGPSLIVYQTGGNELTYPMLHSGEGEGYERAYTRAMSRLRAGAPDAPCLMIGPLDKGTRERGRVLSKPQLARMYEVQRRTAKNIGCAFWDARAVMGGDGGFSRWMNFKPKLASTDLLHLTLDGLELIGQSLADALMLEYDLWREANPEVEWVPVDVDDVSKAPSKRRAAQPWEVWQPPADRAAESVIEDGPEAEL